LAIGLAFKAFFSLLIKGKLSDVLIYELGLTRRVTKAPPAAAAASKPSAPAQTGAEASDGAVQILALLQRESRLIDFLLEDISAYSDEQIGAAIRPVHENSRAALERALRLQPVIDGVEGTLTQLASASLTAKDTGKVKIVGNVPPDGNVEAGILRHRGWKVDRVDLPVLKAGERATVIAPAEIEVE
jgi:hypothetical protein